MTGTVNLLPHALIHELHHQVRTCWNVWHVSGDPFNGLSIFKKITFLWFNSITKIYKMWLSSMRFFAMAVKLSGDSHFQQLVTSEIFTSCVILFHGTWRNCTSVTLALKLPVLYWTNKDSWIFRNEFKYSVKKFSSIDQVNTHNWLDHRFVVHYLTVFEQFSNGCLGIPFIFRQAKN